MACLDVYCALRWGGGNLWLRQTAINHVGERQSLATTANTKGGFGLIEETAPTIKQQGDPTCVQQQQYRDWTSPIRRMLEDSEEGGLDLYHTTIKGGSNTTITSGLLRTERKIRLSRSANKEFEVFRGGAGAQHSSSTKASKQEEQSSSERARASGTGRRVPVTLRRTAATTQIRSGTRRGLIAAKQFSLAVRSQNPASQR